MKSDITSEIEENLNLFLIKYSPFFKMSKVHNLIEEYLSQKYLHTNKIYGYNVTQLKSNINIKIYENRLLDVNNYYPININLIHILRKQKLKKLYESSL